MIFSAQAKWPELCMLISQGCVSVEAFASNKVSQVTNSINKTSTTLALSSQ